MFKSIRLLCLVLLLGLTVQSFAKQEEKSRKLVILGLNDIYRLDNLAYVRTLRSQLEKQHGPILVVHAGDFLFPSLLSRKYNGAQMIDVLNGLDGDGKTFDPFMFITFGNHEFDKSRLKDAAMLQSRITESGFTWLNANVDFRQISSGRKMVQAENLMPHKLIEIQGIKVGLLGLVTDVKPADYIQGFVDPVLAGRKAVRALRKQGAELVVAVTHLSMSRDMQVLRDLGEDAPDIVFGGHEHDRQTQSINNRRIIKADADAYSVSVVTVEVDARDRQGVPKSHLMFQHLPTKDIPADAKLQASILDWQKKFNREYCADINMTKDCLDKPLGKTLVELVAEELRIRKFETNMGNWLTDIAVAAFKKQGAEIAFLNSGGMRINQNIAAGTELTRRHLDSLLAYPTRLVLLELSGEILQKVMSHAVTDWTGNGRWLQISGLAYMHDPDNTSASKLHQIKDGRLIAIDPKATYKVVTNDFLINTDYDQDGFTMLSSRQQIDPKAARPDLKQLIIKNLADNPKGVAPKEEGRICNKADRSKSCLLTGK